GGATFLPATRHGISTSTTCQPRAGRCAATVARSRASIPPPAPWVSSREPAGSPFAPGVEALASWTCARAGPRAVGTSRSSATIDHLAGLGVDDPDQLLTGQRVQQPRAVVAGRPDGRGDRVRLEAPRLRESEHLPHLTGVAQVRVQPAGP